jgi:putative flippase GtrA
VITYLKAQASAIIGSLMDFLTTILLVEVLGVWYVAGNLAGNIVGAITQFIIARNWAFHAENGKISAQVIRYILVWIGNLILSAAGIYFFTHYIKLNYIISKTITSVLLGLTYNYIMQKKFVFAK